MVLITSIQYIPFPCFVTYTATCEYRGRHAGRQAVLSVCHPASILSGTRSNMIGRTIYNLFEIQDILSTCWQGVVGLHKSVPTIYSMILILPTRYARVTYLLVLVAVRVAWNTTFLPHTNETKHIARAWRGTPTAEEGQQIKSQALRRSTKSVASQADSAARCSETRTTAIFFWRLTTNPQFFFTCL